MTEAIQVQVTPEIKDATAAVAEWAAALVVKTDGDRVTALEAVKRIKARRAQVVEFFRENKERAHATWKGIVAQEKEFTDGLDTAERRVKAAVLQWDAEQERIRAAEQRRLQAEADAAAEAERRKLEKEAAKLKTPELKQARLEQAAAIVAPVVQVAPATQAVAGVSGRSTWKAEVIDLATLPREWMLPNQAALDAHARATKGMIPIAGVKFTEVNGLAIR
jgi:hypothetical protein